MADFVNDRIANLLYGIVARARNAADRSAEYCDLVGQQWRFVHSLDKRNATIDSEELAVFVVDAVEVVFPWLVFDRDGEVSDEIDESLRERIQRVANDALELLARKPLLSR